MVNSIVIALCVAVIALFQAKSGECRAYNAFTYTLEMAPRRLTPFKAYMEHHKQHVKAFSRRYMNLLQSHVPAEPLPKEVVHRMDALVRSAPIVVFIKGTPQQPLCQFSSGLLALLKICNAGECKAVDVMDGTSIREDIKAYSKWPTIPQLFIQGEFIGGYDIVFEMFKDGTLQTKLNTINRSSF